MCACLWRGCEGSQPFICGVSGLYIGESLCLVGSSRGLAWPWCDGRAKWIDGQWVVLGLGFASGVGSLSIMTGGVGEVMARWGARR